MSPTIDLKELERKAWKSYFQDGLWDIYFGMLLLASAVSAWLDYKGVPDPTRIPTYVAIMLLGGLFLWAGRTYITAPRLGRVRFGPLRQASRNRLRVVIVVSVFVIWALFLVGLAVNRGWLQQPEPWLLGRISVGSIIAVLNFLVVFSLMAYFLEFPRLYLYAVLFSLQEVAGVAWHEFAGSDIGFIVGPAVAATVALLIGLVSFVRFLREYPVPGMNEQANHHQSR
jgi:uncharacterized membrane protein (DUF485 family)